MAITALDQKLKRIGKLSRLLGHKSFRRGLRQGIAAGVEHLDLLETLELATVVDIGANVGQFSLAVLAIHPNARIYAFEPLVKSATRFGSLFGGQPQVTMYRSAIGPKQGRATMHVSRQYDSSSLLPITDHQSRIFPGTQEAYCETVRIAPLDHFLVAEDIAPTAMLKLDVQGYELEALRGCENLLSRFAHIYVEISFVELYEGQALAHQVIEFLKENGFALTGVYNLLHDRKGRTVQADALFSSSSALRHRSTRDCPA